VTKKVIIDTDPGVDDAMAVLFALRSPELDVLGLTTIFGNTETEVTTQNALRLVELEGNGHIPVARGASQPLVLQPREKGKHFHHPDGFGGINPPPPEGKPLDIPAAQFIVETIIKHPGEVFLAPVGPLTNIAAAVRLEPRIVDLVAEVVIMGGSAYARGNASPVGEANIVNDPHAAAIVFSAGWPLTMVGLDVTKQTVMDLDYLARLAQAGNPATSLITRILPFYQNAHDRYYQMGGYIHTHDPSAIAYLIDPDLFQTKKMPVYVETEGHSAGDTVPDPRRQIIAGPEVNVCLGVNSPALLELYMERLSK
jgi:purine nucleosidase